MELFAFGMLAGALLALIFIGGLNVAMDKGELNKSNSSNIDCNDDGGDNRSLDRCVDKSKIKEVMLLEHAKRIGVRLGG